MSTTVSQLQTLVPETEPPPSYSYVANSSPLSPAVNSVIRQKQPGGMNNNGTPYPTADSNVATYQTPLGFCATNTAVQSCLAPNLVQTAPTPFPVVQQPSQQYTPQVIQQPIQPIQQPILQMPPLQMVQPIQAVPVTTGSSNPVQGI